MKHKSTTICDSSQKKIIQILEFDYQNQPTIMEHLQFLVKSNSSCDLIFERIWDNFVIR